MIVAGVDPGLRACGVAVVDGHGELLGAWLVKSPMEFEKGAPAWRAMGEAVAESLNSRARELGCWHLDLLVVEQMAIRQGPGHRLITKAPAAILGLAAVGGVVLGRVPARAVRAVYPAEWQTGMGKKKKGTDYADVVLARLTDEEKARAPGIEKKSTGHNILDAIGQAKWGAFHGRQLEWTL